MCGIIAIYNNQIKFDKDMRAKSLSMSKKVRHRGPDWSGIYTSDNAILAHERLSIVDIKSGKQPLFSSDKKIVLTVGRNHPKKGYDLIPSIIKELLLFRNDFVWVLIGKNCKIIIDQAKELGVDKNLINILSL